MFLNDETVTTDQIYIPPQACNFRNNCQEAKWFFDGEEVGKDGSEFLFFTFTPYFGDLGRQHQDMFWGQVWGYPLSPSAPPLVFVSYLKTSGLKSFAAKYSKIKCLEKDPTRFIWRSRFTQDSIALPDNKIGKYYLLTWEIEEIEENSDTWALAEKVENAMRSNVERLFDGDGISRMICLLGMKKEEREKAIASFKQKKIAGKDQQQLAAAS